MFNSIKDSSMSTLKEVVMASMAVTDLAQCAPVDASSKEGDEFPAIEIETRHGIEVLGDDFEPRGNLVSLKSGDFSMDQSTTTTNACLAIILLLVPLSTILVLHFFLDKARDR